MTSEPVSAGGMARVWMGVGVEKPAALTARRVAGDRPRVEKSGAEMSSVDTSNAFLSSRTDRPDGYTRTSTAREVASSELARDRGRLTAPRTKSESSTHRHL